LSEGSTSALPAKISDQFGFRWFNDLASGDTATALLAALDFNEVFAEVYGQDPFDDLLSDIERKLEIKLANDDRNSVPPDVAKFTNFGQTPRLLLIKGLGLP
jgi:hypothetical protein